MRFDTVMKIEMIHLPEIKSTNSWMLERLSSSSDFLPEGTVAYTFRQTAGRGQMGNQWESEPDKNLSFSMLLRPEFIPIPSQFVISEMCSLAIAQGLEKCGLTNISVKWPNDIYAGDEKICGILIENRLSGSLLAECVLGVGINVNQTTWLGDAPNPTSMKLQNVSTTPDEVLQIVSDCIVELYEVLKSEGGKHQIHQSYQERLYRKSGYYSYLDASTDEHFEAEIAGIDPQGPLVLRLRDSSIRRYWFKEVRFVLPNGLIKE